jgi:hypothetical protein
MNTIKTNFEGKTTFLGINAHKYQALQLRKKYYE